MTEMDPPPCMIYINKEGAWFHKGSEMIHKEIIYHFYRHMEIDSRGRYIIDLQGERCYVEVEDTPYTVLRAVTKNSDQPGNSEIMLYLNSGEKEELSPDTLRINRENVLYCRVRNGTFPARFRRAAYYQIAEHIRKENGKYYLPLGNQKYFIKT